MVSPINKTDGYIGFGKQSTFGTPVGPTAGLFLKYLSESLVNEQDDLKASEGGFGRYIKEAYKVNHRVSGEISGYLRPDVFGFLAAMTLGKDTFAAATGSTPSIHTLEPLLPGFFTLERGMGPSVPTLIERFQDLYINDLTIDGEQSAPMKFSASLMGTKGVKQVAAGTPTYESNNPIMFFDTPTYKVDGGATVEISKFNIKISNNLDLWYGPSITPTEIIEKLMTVEVGFTLKFLDADHYAKVYYNSGTAIQNALATGSFRVQAGYGATAAERSIDINIKNMIHKGAPVNLAGDSGPIMQECVGYAIKPGADNLIDMVIKNSVDSDFI